MTRLLSHRPHETRQFAKQILAAVPLRTRRGAVILALAGELGTGKTTFIQGLASWLGIRGPVQSPTFVLVKRYRLPRAASRGFRHLVHADAYRLETLAEARHLGLKDMFKDPEAIVVIEWAERIRKLIPRRAIWLRFTHGKRSSERVIKISNSQ